MTKDLILKRRQAKGTASFVLLVACTLVIISSGLLIELHLRMQRQHRVHLLRSQTEQMIFIGRTLAASSDAKEWDVTPQDAKQRWLISKTVDAGAERLQARILSNTKTLAMDEEMIP